MNTQVSLLNTLYKNFWQEPKTPAPLVDCGRCSRGDLSASQRWQAYKCCTFQPFVSCFLAGAMLEDGLDPLAIDPSKVALLPIGIVATREFRERRETLHEDDFGLEQVCSYFDLEKRACKVWRLRPGECSVHFCISNGPREQISNEIFQFEAGVAQMALTYLGFSPIEVDRQLDFLNHPPAGLIGLEPAAARDSYLKAWEWLKSTPPAEVRSWQRFDLLKPPL
jgi:hypothetical protein